MRTLRMRMAAAAVAAAMALFGWPCGHCGAFAGEQPEGPARLGDGLSIYLGCGEVEGPGTVVQLDAAGRERGTVQLANTPYGLAVGKQGLVAAVPGVKKAGKVVGIDAKGVARTIFEDPRAPSPIAIAVDPRSQDILVADNQADVLILLPAGDPKGARTLLQITGHEDHLQGMSVAIANDGRLLFGGSGPTGIYRFRPGKEASLGQPLFAEFGRVAADPATGRWLAAVTPLVMMTRGQQLRLFEGDKEIERLPFPAGTCNWHDSLAFAPDGTLVIALCHTKYLGGDLGYQVVREKVNAFEVVVVDFKAKAFRRLFPWSKSRIESLAVGPKMAWPEQQGSGRGASHH